MNIIFKLRDCSMCVKLQYDGTVLTNESVKSVAQVFFTGISINLYLFNDPW